MPNDPTPETVFVIAHRGKFLTGCKHSDCPTWRSMCRCVRWWKTRDLAQKHLARTRAMPLPGAVVLPPAAVVQEVTYASMGVAPRKES